MSETAYGRAKKKLIEKGYLKQVEGHKHILEFNELI